jgi:hypothetical protein
MSKWTELSWDDAMRRGYEALSSAQVAYDDINTLAGRSNIDIEKHLRRAEVKLVEAQTWFMMARELDRRRDRNDGPSSE